MGRHRNTGIPRAQQAALLASGAFTSHRRVRNPTRARAASALAVGVLATGAVITATNIPWLQDASLPHSRTETPARPDDHRGAAAPAPAVPAAPGVAPAVSPSAPQPAPPTVWRADDPDAFRPTPRNTVGAPPPQVDGGHVSVRLTGHGQRSELEPALPAVQEGDQHDVVLSVLLGRDFPVLGPGHHVIARWENDGPGPAPLDLRVRDGELVLHGGEGHPSGWRTFDRSLGPVPTGQWCQVGVRVCFSADPGKASVSASRDGEPVLTDLHPPGGTLYPGQQSYLKLGLHRDPSIAHPAAVHLRELQAAQTRVTSEPEHRAVAATRSTTSPVTSVPRQRTSSSSAPERGSTGHGSTGHGSTGHGSTGHGSTGHGSTEQRSTPRSSSSSAAARSSAGSATSSRTPAHVVVPRNTPSHISSAPTRAGSQRHADTPHGGSIAVP